MDPVHAGVELPVGAAQVHLPFIVSDGGLGSGGSVESVVVVYPLLGVGKFWQPGRGDDSGLGLETDLGLGFGAALGGDEDHAVCAAHTVEGGGGGILEDAERSDVLGIDEIHVAFHSVHQHERFAVGSEGVHTADPEVGARSRLTCALNDHDTGQFTGEGGGQLSDRDLELFHVDRGDGAYDGSFALRSVGHLHYLFKHVLLRHQLDEDILGVSHLDLFVLVAQEADDEHIARLHLVQDEASGHVRHRTASLSLDGHHRARERQVRFVHNGTGDVKTLCSGHAREQSCP